MSDKSEYKVDRKVETVVLIMVIIGAVLWGLALSGYCTPLEDNSTEFENEICIYETKQKINVNNCVVLDETETTLFIANYLDKQFDRYEDVGVECVLGISYPNTADSNSYNILVFDNQDYSRTHFQCSSISQAQLDVFKATDMGIYKACYFVFDKNKEKQTVFFANENHDEEKCFNSESEVFEYALKEKNK